MRLSEILLNVFSLYFWVVMVRIFLTWVPSIDWSAPFFRALAIVADVILLPFRRIIPPMGGLDFSPIIAILAFQFIANTIVSMLAKMGL